jgi:hypothetical protein
MAAYVYLCGQRTLRNDWAALAWPSDVLFDRRPAYVSRKIEFVKKHAPGFKTWVLQNCKASSWAKKQLLLYTHFANFFGLSRQGVKALSDYDIISPVQSLDRSLASKCANYEASVKYCVCV